jgi:uncharacterized protein
MPLDQSTAGDLRRLQAAISGHESLLVAFSGGVDSALLADVAHRVLGSSAIAVTADSASLPREELAAAESFCRRRGIAHLTVRTGELERPEYARNTTDRCYFCKDTLFAACRDLARRKGMAAVAYGYTADDAGDYRPGHRAALEGGVVAPLHQAGLGKSAIRRLARYLEIDVWDKPAAPCLSSRIPYGSEVTVEKLAVIEEMEQVLHRAGFAICRARFDGRLMRLEVESSMIGRLGQPEVWLEVESLARREGIEDLVIDPRGFRSGALNLGERFDDPS